MSTKAPQVLTRKANGASPLSANEPAKRNGNDNNATNSNTKNSRGKGSGGKQSETAKNPTDGATSRPSRSKPQNEGEKLVVRRLPPGMTHAEFTAILGTEWEAGNGKVDWLSYAAGKISNDLSKPSRPSRAYIHVMRKDDIMPLSEAVRTATWEDAKSSFTNPSLIGPPILELGIYKKVPSSKKRSDTRQGTIDQDPEFMAFLEELANPPAREHVDPDDGDDLSKSEAKITTTPLIEYLKEKKANKHKDNASGKNAKHGRDGKKGGRDDDSKKKSKESRAERSEKGSRETVKILTKKEATEQASEAAKKAAAQITAANASENPRNRRAGIAAAARILQRDLGLSPGSAHRRARQDAAKDTTESKPATGKDATAAHEAVDTPAANTESAPQASKARPATPTAPKAQTSGRRNRGGKDRGKTTESPATQDVTVATTPPVILKKKGDAEGSQAAAESTPAPSTTSSNPTPTPSTGTKTGAKANPSQKKSSITPNATRSFVKHANTSQGVSEATLKQALEAFGSITFVEIDKRKGFAYVDFAEHESLVRAIAASPVTVAQGAVQVLERKDKKPAAASAAGSAAASEKGAGSGSGRGRRGRGGGKGAAAVAQAPAAASGGGTG